MEPSQNTERTRVVEIAKTWLTTKYHHAGRVKGAGVDCLTLLAEVYHEAGLVPRIEIPHYPHDWHLHKSTERYLEGLCRYMHEIEGPPQPGDVVLWKIGRCFSHGAIVIDWPTVIHARMNVGCSYEDALTAGYLTHIGEGSQDDGKPRPIKFFSFWER